MTIPALNIVNVTPGVVSSGGSALDLIALALTTSTYPPIGTVPAFDTLANVQSYFGLASAEAAFAAIYFAGYKNSTKLPGSILFVQYPQVPVAAYLRGGNISAMTLATLQGISGTLIIKADGNTLTASSLNLSAATSFSSAASIIQTALNSAATTIATVTASSSGKVLTVTAVASGTIVPGQTVVGAGVTAGTLILSQTSGTTGGIGVYATSKNNTVSSESMTTTATVPTVTYDSTSGAFILTSGNTGAISTMAYATGTTADNLLLDQADGAVTSQGAAATTPAAFMNGVIGVTQNWATFATIFDPDGGSGNTQKLAFAAWNQTQNNRWAYIAWDTDTGPSLNAPDTTCLAYLCAQGVGGTPYSGTCPIFSVDNTIAALMCGYVASLDFALPNGRTVAAFRQQDGLVATAISQNVAVNLINNDTNFYGAYATANQPFVFFQNGAVSGPFAWLDSYVNQIWMNNSFQLALMTFLANANTVPYNAAGYTQISTALQPKIIDAGSFGVWRAGVTLSTDEIAAVNAQAGIAIANTLSTRGWYLQVSDPPASVRAARGTPICRFFYVDGESVQVIDLSSLLVQ